jgi:hypothetical protein
MWHHRAPNLALPQTAFLSFVSAGSSHLNQWDLLLQQYNSTSNTLVSGRSTPNTFSYPSSASLILKHRYQIADVDQRVGMLDA